MTPIEDSTTTLSMLDRYGGRKYIIPAEVRGRFHRWRNRVHAVLLIVFIMLPWIQINGTQALWFDIPGRRFEFFGQVFLSHDSPLIFFIIALFALLIITSTALWGRAWCGWACPQTVFIESVYRRIERFAEGSYIERRRLRDAPISFEKIRKSGLKWFLFTIVSAIFSHSLIAYFSGSHNLILMMQTPPSENTGYFLLMGFVTALLIFNFGWFREQFCIIMCPYGRFQSALLDSQSVVISYNAARGEPRKSSGEIRPLGDCVGCNRCVQVCPTGIDIRNGLQMECIGCTACIDACDEIMLKVKKPQELISYTSSTFRAYFRPRIFAYVFLILMCSAGLAYNLAKHEVFAAVLLRATDTPYQVMPDGRIMNHFKLHLHNQGYQTQEFYISSESTGVELTQAVQTYQLSSGESRKIHLFVSFPISVVKKSDSSFEIKIIEVSTGLTKNIKSTLISPQH